VSGPAPADPAVSGGWGTEQESSGSGWWRALREPWALGTALASPLALAYALVAPPSGDLAAATYRSGLFSRVGFTLWDDGWYGGHHLPGYSVLAPPLGALLGQHALIALAAVVSAGLFGALAQIWFGAAGGRVAAGWFAVGVCVGLLSGRVAYDVGTAIGLGALLAALRGRATAAVALALLTSLASPVAGAFLALAGIADALAGWNAPARARGLRVAAAALAPIVVFSLAFPEGGWEPYAPSLFWPGLAGVVLIGAFVGPLTRVRADGANGGAAAHGQQLSRGWSALQAGAALYALACVGAFAIHTPVGGNAARLGALFAGPVVGGVLWSANRRVLLAAVTPLLLYWQLETPIHDVAEVAGDPSVNASYYAPLLAELRGLDGFTPVRVEVALTGAHWEAASLAGQPGVSLARGWERQLDTRYAGLFYEPTLTAPAYRGWLADNAVAYVALPDVRLDYSAAQEGGLIERGLPYLREVWRSPHWRLFAVRGAQPLAAAPAVLYSLGSDSFTLSTPRAGVFTVRVRFTPYWALTAGHGCVQQAPDGWTAVRTSGAGTVRVGIDLSLARIFQHGPRCR